MFISKKRHLAIIKEMRHYWNMEIDTLRTENKELAAWLEAMAHSPKRVLPAPVPAVERPVYGIMHILSIEPGKTLCGETMSELSARSTTRTGHLVTRLTPWQLKLGLNDSWCADCLD